MNGLLNPPPDLPEPNSSPTPEDLAQMIFNEHRSAHGPDLDDSIAAIAHVLLNRMSANLPIGRSGRRIGTANPGLPRQMSEQELQFLEKARSAVYKALAERQKGIDPTGGALFFKHDVAPDPRWSPEFTKDWFAGFKFEGKPLANSFGPFENTAPTPVLPAGQPIYLNIYGDQPWGGQSDEE